MTDRVSVRPPRVLLVDDRFEIRQSLRELLEDEGLMVMGEVGDGPEAIQAWRELRPDVIVLDVNLPSMSGIDVARHILEEDPGVKVVFLSAYNDPSMQREASAVGAFAYFVKGCAIDKLLEAIGRPVEASLPSGP